MDIINNNKKNLYYIGKLLISISENDYKHINICANKLEKTFRKSLNKTKTVRKSLNKTKTVRKSLNKTKTVRKSLNNISNYYSLAGGSFLNNPYLWLFEEYPWIMPFIVTLLFIINVKIQEHRRIEPQRREPQRREPQRREPSSNSFHPVRSRIP